MRLTQHLIFSFPIFKSIMDMMVIAVTLYFILTMTYSPGPNNLLCAAHGSQHGFRQTIPLMIGMFFGLAALAVAIGLGAVFIEKNSELIQILIYSGAIYIGYLSYKLAFSTHVSQNNSTQLLGASTGFLLQIVNGKSWIHFIILMTTFASQFGTGYGIKILFALTNSVIAFSSLCVWTFAGTILRKLFNTPKQARVLNLILGISLLSVAIWLILPH